MKTRKKHFFTNQFAMLILLAFTFQQCTERIEVDLDSSYKRLIVDGSLSTENKIHRVRLTTTSDYFENEPAPPVSDAEVFIYSVLDTIKLIENPEVPGDYLTPGLYSATPGISYTLMIDNIDVDADGITEQYSATDKVPGVPVIDSLALLPNDFFGGEFLELVIFAQDPPVVENQYIFNLHINGELVSDTIDETLYTDDDLYDGNYIAGLTVFFLDQKEGDEDEIINEGDTVTLEMGGISSGYYSFLIEYSNVLQGTNPFFGGPPANATSNLSGDALGFFAAYSVTRKSMIYNKDEVSALLPHQ